MRVAVQMLAVLAVAVAAGTLMTIGFLVVVAATWHLLAGGAP